MPKYLYIYRGGMPDADGRQASREEWANWIASLGASIVDPGAPTRFSRLLKANDIQRLSAVEGISGYSIVSASDLSSAAALAKDCPVLKDGGTLEVTTTGVTT